MARAHDNPLQPLNATPPPSLRGSEHTQLVWLLAEGLLHAGGNGGNSLGGISIGYWPGAIRGGGAGFLEESSGGTGGGDSLEESMGKVTLTSG